MDDTGFELDAYFARIGYTGAMQPTEDCLETLHRAQVYTIPFENFDILLGRGISLDLETLFDKLVHHQRGGYCFELNGLYLEALKIIGFDVRPLLARVHLAGTVTGRSHQLELVTIHGKQWITDVGFGRQGLRAPIPLEFNRVVEQDIDTFRLVEVDPFGIVLQYLVDDQWQALYSFDLGHIFPNDIVYGNHYTSTHPNSFFTYARVATLPIVNGRISLYNFDLRVTTSETEQVQELSEGQVYLDALQTNFGIKLDVPYDAIRPVNG